MRTFKTKFTCAWPTCDISEVVDGYFPTPDNVGDWGVLTVDGSQDFDLCPSHALELIAIDTPGDAER